MIANAITGLTGVGGLSYSQTVLADNPIGFWLMDQTSGTTLNDTSGNANNATTYNSPTLNQSGTGGISKSVLFNGTTQYAQTGTVSTFNIAPSANWSVEAWAKTTSSSAYISIMYVGGSGANTSDTLGQLGFSSGKANGGSITNTPGFLNITSSASFNDGNWHHFVMTAASSGALTLYVDGSNVASSSTARRATGNNSFVVIGGQVSQYYFPGNVTAVAIYNTTLSSTRVTAHYNAGK